MSVIGDGENWMINDDLINNFWKLGGFLIIVFNKIEDGLIKILVNRLKVVYNVRLWYKIEYVWLKKFILSGFGLIYFVYNYEWFFSVFYYRIKIKVLVR